MVGERQARLPVSVASKIELTEVTSVFDRRLWRFSIAGKSHTYLQFSNAVAAARTECWENSACERGEKQVQVVVVVVEEEEEEEEEEIENNRRYLHAELTRGPCRGIGLLVPTGSQVREVAVGTVENVQPIPRHLL